MMTIRWHLEEGRTDMAVPPLEQLEGTLVEVSAVQSMVFEEHRRARNQLQIMPARIAAELHAQKDSGAVCLVLEREIQRTLVELCDGTNRKLERMGEGANG